MTIRFQIRNLSRTLKISQSPSNTPGPLYRMLYQHNTVCWSYSWTSGYITYIICYIPWGSAIRLNTGKFPYLGFWALSYFLPKIGQYLIAIPIKQASPYIRLHEKTVQFWGDFGRNSPKIKRFVFSETFWLFLQILPKLEQFFFVCSVIGGCLFNR